MDVTVLTKVEGILTTKEMKILLDMINCKLETAHQNGHVSGFFQFHKSKINNIFDLKMGR